MPIEDVVPLMKSLSKPESKDHGALVNALREHGEEYIMMLLIQKQTKEGCTSPDIQEKYGVSSDYVFHAHHGCSHFGGYHYKSKLKNLKVSWQITIFRMLEPY